MNDLISLATESLSRYLTLRPKEIKEAQPMKWPRHIGLMKLEAHRYDVQDYGNLLTLNTNAMGLMKLATIVLTPNQGLDVPLLLIDVMKMGKKRVVFVEYYNLCACQSDILVEDLHQKYKYLADYKEKDHWYVKEREPYSLIKTCSDDRIVQGILKDEADAYGQWCLQAMQTGNKHQEQNIKQLKLFQHRMIQEGNPSQKTLERVLGKEKAELFFRHCIMPVEKE